MKLNTFSKNILHDIFLSTCSQFSLITIFAKSNVPNIQLPLHTNAGLFTLSYHERDLLFTFQVGHTAYRNMGTKCYSAVSGTPALHSGGPDSDSQLGGCLP